MARFGPASAAEDLEQRTLSQIPSLYGRLVYLASLRNPNTGAYRHHGLELIYGRQESDVALREAHERLFQCWLEMSTEQRFADLTRYLESIGEQRSLVMETWLRTNPFRALMPASLAGPERIFFLGEMETLLSVLSAEAGGRGATRSR
jgi:hypothetical protein